MWWNVLFFASVFALIGAVNRKLNEPAASYDGPTVTPKQRAYEQKWRAGRRLARKNKSVDIELPVAGFCGTECQWVDTMPADTASVLGLMNRGETHV